MPSRSTTSGAKLEQVLEEALRDLPEEQEWSDCFHMFRVTGHPDLATVFRRIATAVPHTRKTDLSFFYWSAAQAFALKQPEMLGEVAANFRRLDLQSYDCDALHHIIEVMLVAGKTREALELLWHFWPILLQDKKLMYFVVPEAANTIVDLRIGLLRRDPIYLEEPREGLRARISAGLEEYLDPDLLTASIDILWGRSVEPEWSKGDFEFSRTRRRRDDDGQDAKGYDRRTLEPTTRNMPPYRDLEVEPLWLAARFAAAESQRVSDLAPYVADRVLWALSVWPDVSDGRPRNLVDLLSSSKLEHFIAATCKGIIDPEPNSCLLLISGLGIFAQFLHSRQYLSGARWERACAELSCLEDLALRMREDK